MGQSLAEQLAPLMQRAEVIEKKLQSFKNETAERKMNAVMVEAVTSVVEAEKKASAVAVAGKPLAADKLDGLEIDAIKEAIEKAEAAGKEATAAFTEVQKTLVSKQSETRSNAGREAVEKVNTRLKVAQGKNDKVKQAIASATKLIKAKELFEKEVEKLKAAEADVEKAEKPVKKGSLTEKGVRAMEEPIAGASRILKPMPGQIKPQLAALPEATKEKLQGLID